MTKAEKLAIIAVLEENLAKLKVEVEAEPEA